MQKKPKSNLAKAAVDRLAEAGRVLSAANEARLQDAVSAISGVLSQLQADDPAADATEAKRKLAEAWSSSAWDASCGAELLSDLVEIMGEESDEPEQFAMLKAAFDALNQWITAEVNEIGQSDDNDTSLGLFDYEAMRSKPVREALVGDVISLKEGAVRSDGSVRMKIIQPGWGSSGYYPAAVLERDGPAIFKTGTKNFWDHPTLTEEVDRPERSLRDLAGELVSDATWEADGPEGAGLYADARVISEFAQPVNELAPFIGVSIRALGTAHNGTVDGQSGPIIDKLLAAESIDYVTTPGAGGRVMQLFEAARRREPITPKEAATQMDPETERKLKESLAAGAEKDKEIARLREAHLIRDAKERISAKLAEIEGVPDVTRARLVESLSRQAKADKDGVLDVKQIDEAIDKTVKEEAEYLAKATGSGSVRGFGPSLPSNGDAAAKGEQLAEAMRGLGLSEAEAKVAAKGR